MKHCLPVFIFVLVAVSEVEICGQQLVSGADPSLVEILGNHSKALETSFAVSIEAQRATGKTNTGKFYRGKAGAGWASRLDTITVSIVLRGKSITEVTIDRPDYHLDLFELNKTGVKASYSDPLMPRINESMMQPPRLDSISTLRRYRTEGNTIAGIVPPKITKLVAKEAFFTALRQQSSKEHLKLFAYRIEVYWFPDRYLISSIKHINNDGDVIAAFQYSGYNFEQLPESLFSIPEDYVLTEVADKSAHVQAITRAKIEASRAEVIQAGVTPQMLDKARTKAMASNAKPNTAKANPKLAFAMIYGLLVTVGLVVLIVLRFRSRKADIKVGQ